MFDGEVIASFEVRGAQPVPYAWHPSKTQNGRTQKLGKEHKSLLDWCATVKAEARIAMAEREPHEGPVDLEIVFTLPTPLGHLDGDPGSQGLTINKYGIKIKKDQQEPDCTNHFKAAEDAIEGVVFVNDAEVVCSISEKRYGSSPGARIVVKKHARRV